MRLFHYQPARGRWNLSLRGGTKRRYTRLWTLREHLTLCQVVQELFPTRKDLVPEPVFLQKVSTELQHRINVTSKDCVSYLKKLNLRIRVSTPKGGPTAGDSRVGYLSDSEEIVCGSDHDRNSPE